MQCRVNTNIFQKIKKWYSIVDCYDVDYTCMQYIKIKLTINGHIKIAH